MRPASDGALSLAFKGAAAALQFVLLVLTARWFGVVFRGEFALFNATVNLIVLGVGFTGGSSIVFLAAREPNQRHLRRLVAVSYAFCVLVPVVLVFAASRLGAPLGHHAALVALVAVMNAAVVVNVCVLLAGHAVWQAGLLDFLRPFAVVALAATVAATRGFRSPDEFYVVWAIASVAAFVLSLPLVLLHHARLAPRGDSPAAPLGQVVRQLVGFGSLAQASNVVQFLNYRSLYFALERHAGLAAVGLFSTAVALAEVLWIPANSLAALALNRVSRAPDADGTRAFVMRLLRLAFVAMIVAATAATIVPIDGITALLGRDFGDVRGLLVRLLPGVVAIGVSLVASAYHAGHGLYGRNLVAALAGLALTAIGYALWIPHQGLDGAVLAMNASYIATSACLLVWLARRERVRPGELVPRAADLPVVRAGDP
jgi:O-antigen/teichoic acid export membrane protein